MSVPVRRRLFRLIGVIAAIGLLVAAFFVADTALRGWAETRIADQLTADLPPGVQVHPQVSIGGASIIVQYLGGSLGEVTVDADSLTVNGVPLPARIHARGVPVDSSKPVQRVTGQVTVSQAALNRLTRNEGVPGEVKLGEGTVGYDSEVSLFGFSIGYHVSATPVVAGPRVLLTADAVQVTSAPIEVDAAQLLDDLATRPVPVCAAAFLPVGIDLTGLSVAPGVGTVTVQARQLVLATLDVETKGSCP